MSPICLYVSNARLESGILVTAVVDYIEQGHRMVIGGSEVQLNPNQLIRVKAANVLDSFTPVGFVVVF